MFEIKIDLNEGNLNDRNSTAFRGVLDVSVNLGIIDKRQKDRIWQSWMTWDGNLKNFLNRELKRIVKPKQQSQLMMKMGM